MKPLKVLIACEESQRVCIEFRKLGHEAYSADIQEPSGGHPEWHIHGDVLEVLNPYPSPTKRSEPFIWFPTMDGGMHCVDKWDLIIAHPPCTYLSNAGACRLYPKAGVLNEERYKKGLEAKEFFMKFINADCEHIAVENPLPSKIYNLPPYTQIVQPYEYGHKYSKKTLLWLKGLPNLVPTKIMNDYNPFLPSYTSRFRGENRRGVNGTAKFHSKTFEGIAQAMAYQWSAYLTGQTDKQLSFFEE